MRHRLPLLRTRPSESSARFRAEARMRGDAKRSALNRVGDSEHTNIERQTQLMTRICGDAMTGGREGGCYVGSGRGELFRQRGVRLAHILGSKLNGSGRPMTSRRKSACSGLST